MSSPRVAMDAVPEGDVGERGKRDSSIEDPSDGEEFVKPRDLPADLPRTLDDRKNFAGYKEETEYYDAWQGACRTVCYREMFMLMYCRPVAVPVRSHYRTTN